MGRQAIDITGQRFGILTVLGRCSDGRPGTLWSCQCECGRIKAIASASLRDGRSQSCGCKNREATSKRFTTHGRRHSREYESWAHAKQRCTNPNNKDWALYGGAGIEMRQPYLDSFEALLTDLSQCPPGKTLDRYPNPYGHYEKGNVRWASWIEQQRNKRNNRRLTLNGETLLLMEWAERIGISRKSLDDRLKHGMSVEEALTTPKLSHRGPDRRPRSAYLRKPRP